MIDKAKLKMGLRESAAYSIISYKYTSLPFSVALLYVIAIKSINRTAGSTYNNINKNVHIVYLA